jgi:hypothetical protein
MKSEFRAVPADPIDMNVAEAIRLVRRTLERIRIDAVLDPCRAVARDDRRARDAMRPRDRLASQAAWILLPDGVAPMASMVVIRFPTAAETGVMQDRTGFPSIWIVHAPQRATPQPNLCRSCPPRRAASTAAACHREHQHCGVFR